MRAPFEEAVPDLAGCDPATLAAAAESSLVGVTFGEGPFRFDPVPRIIPAAEWEPLAAGLAQRVRALDRWCADAYGERAIVRDGVLPARVVETVDTLEPELTGLELPMWVGIAGLDVVRAPDGRRARSAQGPGSSSPAPARRAPPGPRPARAAAGRTRRRAG